MSDNLHFYWTLLAATIIVIMSQTTFDLLFLLSYTFFLPYGSYEVLKDWEDQEGFQGSGCLRWVERKIGLQTHA